MVNEGLELAVGGGASATGGGVRVLLVSCASPASIVSRSSFTVSLPSSACSAAQMQSPPATVQYFCWSHLEQQQQCSFQMILSVLYNIDVL